MNRLICRWRGHDIWLCHLYSWREPFTVVIWQCRRCHQITGGEVKS